jgi:hypothetical protein
MAFNYLFLTGFLLSLLLITNGQFTNDHLIELQALECDEPSITLHVFSGTPNPVWKLNMNQLTKIKKAAYETLKNNDNLALLNKPTTRIMGYHGFTISCSSDKYVFVNGLSPLEHLLLLGGRRYLSTSIVRHVKDHLGEIMSDTTDVESVNAGCDRVPIKGPDTVPKYDPNTDDEGCFVKKQSENNCYAYGNEDSSATITNFRA